MSDAAPPQMPPAGWYAHPQDATQERWWSGVAWTEHFRTVAAPLPTPPAAPRAQPSDEAPAASIPSVPLAPAIAPTPQRIGTTGYTKKQLKAAEYRAARRRNIYGYLGCVFGLIAFILDVFAIPSILAVVFASIGIATSSRLGGGKGTGAGWSVTGLVLGVVSLGLFVWSLHLRGAL